MSSTRIASRYAKALYIAFGDSTAQSESTLQALRVIRELYDLDIAKKVLCSPVMTTQLKSELLGYANTQILDLQIKKVVGALSEQLLLAGRAELWPDILGAFDDMVARASGQIKATVEVVEIMNDGALNRLTLSLSKLTGKEVRLEQKVNAQILGGLVVRMGNAVIDLSMKKRLNEMARTAVS